MIKKQTKNKLSRQEYLFTSFGLLVIVVGCIANLYSAYVNQRFIHDPFLDPQYYFRYVILLLGGFGAGYLLTKKETAKQNSFRMSKGVFYAVFAVMLYSAFDIVHFMIRALFGMLGFPWEKILLEGVPIFAVFVTFLIVYLTQFRPERSVLSSLAKKLFVLVFAAHEIYNISTSIYYFNNETSVWMLVASYATAPIVIAVISYLVLGGKKTFERLFYAVFAGALYESLSVVLWEFRTDASAGATMTFDTITMFIALGFTALLVWQTRKAIKEKSL